MQPVARRLIKDTELYVHVSLREAEFWTLSLHTSHHQAVLRGWLPFQTLSGYHTIVLYHSVGIQFVCVHSYGNIYISCQKVIAIANFFFFGS